VIVSLKIEDFHLQEPDQHSPT